MRKPTPPEGFDVPEWKILCRVIETPGIAAADLPRGKRGATLRALEMRGLIHNGPGGWYPTSAGLEYSKENES